jgi:hypothetical protein
VGFEPTNFAAAYGKIGALSKQDGNATTTAIHTMIFLISYKRKIIKSHTGVRDVVLLLFTTAKQRFSRLVYNANLSRRDK